MSPRQALERFSDWLLGSEFDRGFRRASHGGRSSFLFAWNRALGDVGLGLTPYFQHIRETLPQARIDVVTRADLEPVFRLARVDRVFVVNGLRRGVPLDVREAAPSLGLDLRSYGAVFANPQLGRWARGEAGARPPRLHWDARLDALADAFALPASAGPLVGVHVSSETSMYYRHAKDWARASWLRLFERVREEVPAQFVLLGQMAEPRYAGEGIVDLRGRTSLHEALAVVLARCQALVAPDSGILSVVYLLDAGRELDVFSLWGDPRQGILKHGIASPNPGLRHRFFCGDGEDVARIPVDEVAAALVASLRARGDGRVKAAA